MDRGDQISHQNQSGSKEIDQKFLINNLVFKYKTSRDNTAFFSRKICGKIAFFGCSVKSIINLSLFLGIGPNRTYPDTELKLNLAEVLNITILSVLINDLY